MKILVFIDSSKFYGLCNCQIKELFREYRRVNFYIYIKFVNSHNEYEVAKEFNHEKFNNSDIIIFQDERSNFSDEQLEEILTSSFRFIHHTGTPPSLVNTLSINRFCEAKMKSIEGINTIYSKIGEDADSLTLECLINYQTSTEVWEYLGDRKKTDFLKKILNGVKPKDINDKPEINPELYDYFNNSQYDKSLDQQIASGEISKKGKTQRDIIKNLIDALQIN